MNQVIFATSNLGREDESVYRFFLKYGRLVEDDVRYLRPYVLPFAELKKGLKTGQAKGYIFVPSRGTRIPTKWEVSKRQHTIGCMTFDRAAWQTLMKAVNNANTKSKSGSRSRTSRRTSVRKNKTSRSKA